MLNQLIEDMKNCEQTKGQSVYEHGLSVYLHFKEWCDGENKGWKIPNWLNLIRVEDLHKRTDIVRYTLFHDCGKPYCRIEVDGKPHFPNHTNVSADKYCEATGDLLISSLIRDDMVLHICSAKEIEEKLKNEWSMQTALTILIISLCEIHSNAQIFGGQDSISFKSKWKKLDQRGRQILNYYQLL